MAKPPKPQVSRAREARAWELRIQGHTEAAIAHRLTTEGLGPITQQAVHAALKRVAARELAELDARRHTWTLEQAARLELIYGEAMRAWDRSKGPARTARERRSPGVADGGGPAPPRVETSVSIAERVGDPRFLSEARAALADLRKLLGLDAPDKVLLGGLPDPIAVQVRGLSDDDLAKLEAILGRAGRED